MAESTGSSASLTVGEPSWLQVCNSVGNIGISLVGYEIFPVTVSAAPDTTFTLESGNISTPAQKIMVGSANGTAWYWPNPRVITTNAEGVARSNLTLIGAVMPFVPNDIANFSLPVIAQASNGLTVTAGLPIEITMTGTSAPDLLDSPGAISFTGTLDANAGNPAQFVQVVGYTPSSANASPVRASLGIAGSWENGNVGPLPAGVQVTLADSTFEIGPGQVTCFWVDVTNDFNQSTFNETASFTLAVQESVSNGTYLEPLTVSIAPEGGISPGGFSNGGSSAVSTGLSVSNPSTGRGGQGWPELLVLAAVIVVSGTIVGLFFARRRLVSQGADSPPDP